MSRERTQRSPLVLSRGKRAWVWDLDGNRYVDWYPGLTTVSLGYAHPYITECVHAQLERALIFIFPPSSNMRRPRHSCGISPKVRVWSNVQKMAVPSMTSLFVWREDILGVVMLRNVTNHSFEEIDSYERGYMTNNDKIHIRYQRSFRLSRCCSDTSRYLCAVTGGTRWCLLDIARRGDRTFRTK